MTKYSLRSTSLHQEHFPQYPLSNCQIRGTSSSYSRFTLFERPELQLSIVMITSSLSSIVRVGTPYLLIFPDSSGACNGIRPYRFNISDNEILSPCPPLYRLSLSMTRISLWKSTHIFGSPVMGLSDRKLLLDG